MATLLVQLSAAAAFLAFAFWLFRLAMGLRYAKVLREEARRAEQARGRRLIAEVPAPSGELLLFFEGRESFLWGERSFAKPEILGARLLLNRRAVAACSRPGVVLPPGEPEEEYDGRERWDVALSLSGGEVVTITCGTLREGVSREAAQRVFDAVSRVVGEPG